MTLRIEGPDDLSTTKRQFEDPQEFLEEKIGFSRGWGFTLEGGRETYVMY